MCCVGAKHQHIKYDNCTQNLFRKRERRKERKVGKNSWSRTKGLGGVTQRHKSYKGQEQQEEEWKTMEKIKRKQNWGHLSFGCIGLSCVK